MTETYPKQDQGERMIREHTQIHKTTAVLGFAAILADAGSNIEFMWRQIQTLYDTNMLVVLMVAVCGAFALTASIKAHQQGDRWISIILFLGFLASSVFSLTATYHRVTSSNQNSTQQVLMKDSEYKSMRLIYQVAMNDASVKCSADPNVSECVKAQSGVKALKLKLDERKDELLPKLPGLSAEMTAMLPNLMAPLALYIFGNCLLAFGLNGRIVRPEFELGAPDKPLDKASRFVLHYVNENGVKPNVALIMERTGVSAYYARRALK